MQVPAFHFWKKGAKVEVRECVGRECVDRVCVGSECVESMCVGRESGQCA